MIKEALKYLVELGKPNCEVVHGVTWADKHLHAIEPPQIGIAAVEFPTLGGFVDYCLEGIDQLPEKMMVHVRDPWTVVLLGPLQQVFRTREIFATAAFDENAIYKFGQQATVERFIIDMMTLFEATPERARLLELVGNMKNEKVNMSRDDGITQEVAMKAGAVMVARKEVGNPFTLKPYRTFPEVEQPESPFILRLHQQQDTAMPNPALYQCDNGRWKIRAHEAIGAWLTQELAKLGGKMPILA